MIEATKQEPVFLYANILIIYVRSGIDDYKKKRRKCILSEYLLCTGLDRKFMCLYNYICVYAIYIYRYTNYKNAVSYW